MDKQFYQEERGLIKMIIVIIIAIVILSYFGIDLKNLFTSEQVQKNLHYVWNFIAHVWTTFLAEPFWYLWGIWVEYIWTPFINFLKSIQS